MAADAPPAAPAGRPRLVLKPRDDSAAAKRAVDHLRALYAARPDAQLGLRDLKQYDSEILDGRDRIRLAERHLVDWRDAEAYRIMLAVHTQGQGLAGVYPWEVAETKVETVREMAKSAGFPLRAVIEGDA